MVVVMERVVALSGGPHRDALFVNGILGWLTTAASRGGISDESRSRQAKEGLAVKREPGATGGTAQRQHEVQSKSSKK